MGSPSHIAGRLCHTVIDLLLDHKPWGSTGHGLRPHRNIDRSISVAVACRKFRVMRRQKAPSSSTGFARIVTGWQPRASSWLSLAQIPAQGRCGFIWSRIRSTRASYLPIVTVQPLW